MRKYAVEAIGTFIFAYTVINAVNNGGDLAPLAIGAILMVMVYAGGHISGGHFNPAVSLAAWVRGRLETKDLLPYWVAQIGGALVAGLLGMWMYDNDASGHYSGKNLAMALLVEVVFTFALAWVVLNVATSKDHPDNSFYGLAIGFTVVSGAISVAAVSGAAFNPAIAVGLSVDGASTWANYWIYIVSPLIGGALAGFAFTALNLDDA
jgi:aquaporin Z